MEEKIIEFFANCYNKDAADITPQTRLQEDLHSASVQLFPLLAMLEGEYEKELELGTALEMKTVQDFIDYYADAL